VEGLADLIQTRATAAARRAYANLGVIPDREDFQDVVQGAAEGFWRAWNKCPGEIGYAVVAARNAATKCIIREVWGKNPFTITAPIEDEFHTVILHNQQEEIGDLPEEILRELYRIFLASRSKRGRRGMLASARDVFVINALHKEWGNEAIATALGKPVDSVKKYRRRIQSVLKEQQDG